MLQEGLQGYRRAVRGVSTSVPTYSRVVQCTVCTHSAGTHRSIVQYVYPTYPLITKGASGHEVNDLQAGHVVIMGTSGGVRSQGRGRRVRLI